MKGLHIPATYAIIVLSKRQRPKERRFIMTTKMDTVVFCSMDLANCEDYSQCVQVAHNIHEAHDIVNDYNFLGFQRDIMITAMRDGLVQDYCMSTYAFTDLIDEQEWVFCEEGKKEVDNPSNTIVKYEVTDDADEDTLRFCDTFEDAITYAENTLQNDCWNGYSSLQIIKRSKVATVNATVEVKTKVIYNNN